MNTLGCILYRAGRFKEAVQRLSEVEPSGQKPDKGTSSSPAYTCFFLAMAHDRLGHREEAKMWLEKASQSTENAVREHQAGAGPACPWNRRLTLKLLREEAEALRKSAPQTPKTIAKQQEAPKKTQ